MALVLLVKSIMGHRLLTLPNIVFVTTVLNFVLYLCGWSANFSVPCSDTTYAIVIVVEIVFTLYAFVPARESMEKRIIFKVVSIGPLQFHVTSLLLSLSLLILVIENVYLFGTLFASNSSYHTAVMPVLGPVNRALIPVAYSAMFMEMADRRSTKTGVVFFLLHAAYSVIGARGRFWFVVSIACALLTLTVYKRGAILGMRMRYKLPIVLGVIALSIIMFNFGVERMAQSYSFYVAYSGPFQDFELASWYYGYFPYSFYNLDLTVRRIEALHAYTNGAFLALPFLSVLQLDGIFGLSYNTLTMSTRVITNTAATVATGYYEMYADFGPLFVITILVYLAITFFFERRDSFVSLVSSRYMWVVWGAMSFLNIFTVGIPLYVFILAWLVGRFGTEKSRQLKTKAKTLYE